MTLPEPPLNASRVPPVHPGRADAEVRAAAWLGQRWTRRWWTATSRSCQFFRTAPWGT